MRVCSHGYGQLGGKTEDTRKRENKCWVDQYLCIDERGKSSARLVGLTLDRSTEMYRNSRLYSRRRVHLVAGAWRCSLFITSTSLEKEEQCLVED